MGKSRVSIGPTTSYSVFALQRGQQHQATLLKASLSEAEAEGIEELTWEVKELLKDGHPAPSLQADQSRWFTKNYARVSYEPAEPTVGNMLGKPGCESLFMNLWLVAGRCG